MKGRTTERHMIDGTEMTAQQIADMLGCTLNALQSRKCKLGGISYQALVNMYRENQFGFGSDGKVPRYLVEGRWMTRRQIAEMLEISPKTLTNWLCGDRGRGMEAAIAWFRQYQTGERKRHHGQGGRKPTEYQAGKKTMTIPQVARRFGVTHTSVSNALKRRGGDMAATIRHYREREAQMKRRAEGQILEILGF